MGNDMVDEGVVGQEILDVRSPDRWRPPPGARDKEPQIGEPLFGAAHSQAIGQGRAHTVARKARPAGRTAA